MEFNIGDGLKNVSQVDIDEFLIKSGIALNGIDKCVEISLDADIKNKKCKINSTYNALKQLEAEVQKITVVLIDVIKDDVMWWKENIYQLASQPWYSLLEHLRYSKDASLVTLNINLPIIDGMSYLEPLEALVWLAGLCHADQILIGSLPRQFVDDFCLQWRVLALNWIN